MLREPAMRASDVDREAAVDLLRNHHDQGRLTLDEFTDRVGSAYGAVTLGELAVLLKDLPPPEHLEYEVEVLRAAARNPGLAARNAVPPLAVPRPAPRPAPYSAPAPPPQYAEPERRGTTARQLMRGLWTAVLAVTFVNTVIWLLVLVSQGPVYFWPIWVFGPPAALLGAVELCLHRHPENGAAG
ncbi:DUF1707 SHOCT-like domain-containing protein [Yinghuangia soli]|uniref:DUF1707 domain-containing protein n=1 Tax=Yinghuangia soli TaxID=2908204 RepID=A0AA41U129_9ACTN|nr:DUF1707 domain-containing protein [Yinghuangia soli]MCF2529110.1 DUF1707 domain-containing protein [Yinghuangia soli]